MLLCNDNYNHNIAYVLIQNLDLAAHPQLLRTGQSCPEPPVFAEMIGSKKDERSCAGAGPGPVAGRRWGARGSSLIRNI